MLEVGFAITTALNGPMDADRNTHNIFLYQLRKQWTKPTQRVLSAVNLELELFAPKEMRQVFWLDAGAVSFANIVGTQCNTQRLQ